MKKPTGGIGPDLEEEIDKEKRLKNETTQEPVDNKEENENSPESPERSICLRCQKNLVELDKGKPRGKKSKLKQLSGNFDVSIETVLET